MGNLKVKELLEIASAEVLIHFMLKEIEMAWRMKFGECQSFVYKDGVDQMILIVDLKGAKLKDLSNKQVFFIALIPLVKCYFQIVANRILKILSRTLR